LEKKLKINYAVSMFNCEFKLIQFFLKAIPVKNSKKKEENLEEFELFKWISL